MNSATWIGVAAGLGLFLLISVVSLLTPARVPVLKAAGRDYAALRLERRILGIETSGPQTPARLKALETRIEAFNRRNANLSAFGLLGSLIDLWPWLIGLGFALPVLGGLIGAQVRASGHRDQGQPGHKHARAQDLSPMPEHNESQIPPVHENPVTPSAAVDVASDMTPPPSPPETWSWNAKAVGRASSDRPKPPPVKSPNGDTL